ncbi:MAG: M56 family metallopeptidase [Planctomycetes bacterium]|nr:M56 family metallopeptidase [Planctomycetota bacterium]
MDSLNAIVGSDVAYRLGWAVLHTVWGAAAIALLWGAATAALRRRSANARYLAGCVAMAMMAAFPMTAFLRTHAPERPHQATVDLPAIAFVIEPLGGAIGPGTLGDHPPGPLPPPRARMSWLAVASRALEPAVPWVALAWMAGVLVLSVRQAGGWIGARRLTRRGTRAAAAGLTEALARLAKRLRVTRPVRLLESALVKVPTVIGWLQPVILTPVGFAAGLSAEQVEALLAHELAHIRRGDYLVNLLQSLVETLLFYHPAVWLVSRRVRIERENCCDDLVVACGGEPAAYADALARVAERAVGGRPRLAAAALGAANRPSELRVRVARLLGRGAEPKAHGGRAWPLALALILVLAAVSYVNCRSPESPAPADMAASGRPVLLAADARRAKAEDDIREAVFRHKLSGRFDFVHFLSVGKDGGDPTDEFMKRLADLGPNVKKVSQSTWVMDTVRNKETDAEWVRPRIKDKETGERGRILRVTEIKWVSDTEAEAEGSCEEAVEIYSANTYYLKREADRWVVTKEAFRQSS